MPTENKKMKISLETIMEKIQCASYDDWVKNFALNLTDIWNEPSAAELTPTNGKTKLQSAIVIGRGPSVKKKGHLEMLVKSNFNGAVVCCDGALITALKAGVTPERFPNFYVVTIDPYPLTKKFYELRANHPRVKYKDM